MEYNSQLAKLILPEYGRNIQKMVEYVKNIEDRDERNKMARGIIAIMGNMNPHLRDINDFKHKLWDHLMIMSDFKLDIDSPYPIPTKETFEEKPKQVPYDNKPIRHRYLGKIIEKLINKATQIEDEEERKALIEIIANHMKKSYLMWNKETVDDDIILSTIDDLSKGKLRTDNIARLTDTKDIFNKTNKRKRISRKDQRRK